MDFKIGYKVKPKEINNVNKVIFEEFVDIGVFRDVVPTQDECEAYGFSYKNNNCWAVNNETDFVNDYSINQNGKRNVSGLKSDSCYFIGIDNELSHSNNNDLIVGNNNTIKDNIDNTIISGTKAEATASNSIVLGGNQNTDNLAERQFTTLMYGRKTTNGGTQASYLNNLTANFFEIPTDTAMYFHAEILAVRVGGTATGSPGDYASWLERGVVINKSGVLSIKRARKSMQSEGNHTNWRPTAAVSGTNFQMNVRGDADMIIEWASTIRFTEIRTNTAL